MTHDTPLALPPFNKRGQRLGPKGLATRDVIMEVTLNLLRELPLWQVNPSDIANASDIQQSNFYTYFDSVEEVILALAYRGACEAPDHNSTVPALLQGEPGIAWIRSIVEASISEWQKYGPVLRIVEMLADNDVPEFRQSRRLRLDSLRDILGAAISSAQADGRLNQGLNVRLAVYAILSLIRVTAEHYNLTRSYPMTHQDIVNTTTYMAHLLLTGQSHLSESQPPTAATRKKSPAGTLR